MPGIGLNASFAHTDALPGKIAFVSQSGALVTGVLDWAKSRGIGFSRFISLGDSADVDFGDVLDYLASDGETGAILLYIEDVRHARKFMSAARAAARSKPVVVLKAGRVPEGAKAAASHTGALAGSDDVYDAAIRRAGMLRVLTTEDLFAAVETLAHARPLHGERLAIMTNGGGPGVMATDALVCAGGKLATLSADTLRRLDEVLPATWSHANPVDIIGDAPAERYRADAGAAAGRTTSPTRSCSSTRRPRSCPAPTSRARSRRWRKAASRNMLACWLGGDAVAEARRIFSDAGIPTFDTPEDAVNGYLQIVHYRQNQNLLMQVPASASTEFEADRDGARARDPGRAGRGPLPAVRAGVEGGAGRLRHPGGADAAGGRRRAGGGGGRRDRLPGGGQDRLAAGDPQVRRRRRRARPRHAGSGARGGRSACRSGWPSCSRRRAWPASRCSRWRAGPDAHELIVGAATDAVFGPVILFGQGGIAVEVTADHAVALPPLNTVLARDMVGAHPRGEAAGRLPQPAGRPTWTRSCRR